ncbi:MAG: tRNA uridine-5-carboxymethylaminomethyl(34) synthesis GTPase MnmE [Desulfuromonadaceae bacterium]|nr:tRNA uridine-5-carboxymethylaminomethyl(34) synthesis GTPase MnmE [Desulfuromonadaceae bacterium]
MYLLNDTIVAPATTVGNGGIAIVRISGDLSLSLLKLFFKPSSTAHHYVSHQLVYGHFGVEGCVVDEVMAVYMQAPRSFTREDVVEIHCHSSSFIVERVIDLLISSGARMAQPGEFTFRAFMHGRIDLTSAQAVSDIVSARSRQSSRVAVRQLEGVLRDQIDVLKGYLIEMLALTEAYLDFPEEEVDGADLSMLFEHSSMFIDLATRLIGTFQRGHLLKEGLSVLILGSPNVGKSSLLNLLLGKERAIVTDVPGTTRDFLTEDSLVGSVVVRFIDTAGIRDSVDLVEQEGVRRALSFVSRSDLVLYVVDGTASDQFSDAAVRDIVGDTPCLIVVNKSDVDGFDIVSSSFPIVSISAKTGAGLEDLIYQVGLMFSLNFSGDDATELPIITDRRHCDVLCACLTEVQSFVDGVRGSLYGEFLATHLNRALYELGTITGQTAPDDILNDIFSRFCVGK